MVVVFQPGLNPAHPEKNPVYPVSKFSVLI